MLRRVLIGLLSSLFVLIVAFAVLMGGYALAQAMQDEPGARILMWIARGCMLLIATDLVLLISALGVHAVLTYERRDTDAGP